MKTANKVFLATVVLIFGMSFMLVGCGKDKQSVSGSSKEPDWVTKCDAAFKDAGKDAFYGCGSVTGIQNRSLQTQTADQRAKADLAGKLDTYVASFMKDYMSSASSGDITESEEEQVVESITKSITEATLYGVQQVDRWRSPEDGTLYSVVKVSFDSMAQSMRKAMKQRSEEIRYQRTEI